MYPPTSARRRQRWVAAVLLLTLAWAVLAPSLALATGKLAVGSWSMLCTADGQLRLTADPAASLPKAPEQAAIVHIGEHCPFCHLVPSHPAVPMQPQPGVPKRFVQYVLPPERVVLLDSLAFWPPAQSRAPPTGSLDP